MKFEENDYWSAGVLSSTPTVSRDADSGIILCGPGSGKLDQTPVSLTVPPNIAPHFRAQPWQASCKASCAVGEMGIR